MKWTSLFWVVMSIAATVSGGSRHKRTLSFITNLFSDDVESGQEKCTKTQLKPSKGFEILELPGRGTFVVETVPEITRSQIPKRIKNNEDSFLINLARYPFQALTQAFGAVSNTLSARTSTEKPINERPQNINYLSGYRLTVNHKSTMTPEKLNVDNIVYERPESPVPSVVQFVRPIISMPRKYSYEQIKGDTLQTFSLDKNSDVIVTEKKKHIPRPAFVDDRMKDIIFSIPPNTQHIYSSNNNDQYGKTTIKSNMVIGQHRDGLTINMLPSNDISMFTGEPIIVLEQDNEINKITERNIKEKPRGDVPD